MLGRMRDSFIGGKEFMEALWASILAETADQSRQGRQGHDLALGLVESHVGPAQGSGHAQGMEHVVLNRVVI